MSEQTTEQNSAPQINIADLATAVNIIDHASSKGAFTGPDIEIVGKTRNRIHAFVEANLPSQEQTSEDGKESSDAGTHTETVAEPVTKAKKITRKKKA